jgi:hypothetical protein
MTHALTPLQQKFLTSASLLVPRDLPGRRYHGPISIWQITIRHIHPGFRTDHVLHHHGRVLMMSSYSSLEASGTRASLSRCEYPPTRPTWTPVKPVLSLAIKPQYSIFLSSLTVATKGSLLGPVANVGPSTLIGIRLGAINISNLRAPHLFKFLFANRRFHFYE